MIHVLSNLELRLYSPKTNNELSKQKMCRRIQLAFPIDIDWYTHVSVVSIHAMQVIQYMQNNQIKIKSN